MSVIPEWVCNRYIETGDMGGFLFSASPLEYLDTDHLIIMLGMLNLAGMITLDQAAEVIAVLNPTGTGEAIATRREVIAPVLRRVLGLPLECP